MHNRIRIQITGTVQGVGFRPFIYNLANKYNLKGFCLNDSRGVLIEVQGELIDSFIEEIKTSPPPLSRIERLTSQMLAGSELYKDFSIRESVSHEGNFTFVSPDIATCQEWLKKNFYFYFLTDYLYFFFTFRKKKMGGERGETNPPYPAISGTDRI